jgi:hypothetical protein
MPAILANGRESNASFPTPRTLCRSRHIVITFLGRINAVEISRPCSMSRAVEMQTTKFCGAAQTHFLAKE